MKHHALAVFAALAASLLPGCGHATKPIPRLDERSQTARFPALDDAWRTLGYKLDWVGYPFTGIDRPDAVQHISPHDDVVIVQERGSTVTLLEANTGAIRWRQDLTNPLTRFVGLTRSPVDAGKVMASSESEVFILDVKTGNLIGRQKFPKVVSTAPVADGNTLVLGTAGGELAGFRTDIGQRTWGFQAQGELTANPVRAGSLIAAVTQTGDCIFVQPRTGTLVGRAKIFGGLANNPVAFGDAIIVAGLDQSVWSFASNGATRWRHRTSSPLRSQPFLASGTLYIDVPGEGFTALEAGTGKVKWKNPKLAGEAINLTTTGLIVRDGESIALVDPARGDVITTVAIPGVTRVFSSTPENGTLYASTRENLLAKLTRR
jgi:outer membrane protein assembly factor BamB